MGIEFLEQPTAPAEFAELRCLPWTIRARIAADESLMTPADALGLRPLWALETPADYVFSSEPGVVSVDEDGLVTALAPGSARIVAQTLVGSDPFGLFTRRRLPSPRGGA